jgi:hypothetical protein
MANKPVASPGLRGVKVTLVVQLAPGATEVPQSLLSAKSAAGGLPLMFEPGEAPSIPPAAVMPIPLIFRLVLSVLVRVTIRGPLVLPRGWRAKPKTTGESFTTVPTPISGTTCGLPVASSEMVRAPVLTPFALGAKVTLMVQEVPAATLRAQLLVWEKSPLTVMLVLVSAAVPVLLSVTRCEALVVPTSWPANVRPVGATLAMGRGG